MLRRSDASLEAGLDETNPIVAELPETPQELLEAELLRLPEPGSTNAFVVKEIGL